MRSNKWMVWTLAWDLMTIGVLAAAGWQASIAAPQTSSAPTVAPAGNSSAAQNPAPPPDQQPAAPANLPANTPVIKTESRVVAVDSVVTDKKGNYVRDLTKTDFKVFEDKQEQPIVNFSNASAAGGSDGSGATRYLVLFFDDSTTVSYTHLDVYKRQSVCKAACLPRRWNIRCCPIPSSLTCTAR